MSEKGYKTDMPPAFAQEIPKEYRIIKFGGYDWRVLDEQNGKMFVITDKIIDYKRYHEPNVKIIWEECELREYLNKQFIAEFSEEEKARIIKTKLINKNNPWYAPGKGGDDTEDYIFLPSIDDIVKYFGDSGDLEKRKGWYWAGDPAHKVEEREYDINEMLLKNGRGQFLYDQYNDARIAKNLNNEGSWWRLRSPGRQNIYTVVVNPIGAVILTGTPHGENGMRPAMWVSA